MRKILILGICFLLIFFLYNMLFDKRDISPSPESEPRVVGIPNISDTYSALDHCSLDQIVEDNENIYVLYGEHEGNIQVFNHDGEHQYSAYFATHLNGAFSIAAEDGVLYVRDEQWNLYVLEDGRLKSFYYSGTAEHILNRIDFHCSSSKFIERNGSIWRVDGDSSVCVVKRSPLAALYQGNTMFILSLFLIATIGVMRYKYKNRNCSG